MLFRVFIIGGALSDISNPDSYSSHELELEPSAYSISQHLEQGVLTGSDMVHMELDPSRA